MKGKRVRTVLGTGTVIREFEQEDTATGFGMTKGAIKVWLEIELDGHDYPVNFQPFEVSEIYVWDGPTRGKLIDYI